MTGADLAGRTALVTGSSRGIGRALADGLLAAGARVVLNGRDTAVLEETRARLAATYGEGRVLARDFDVTDEAAVTLAVDELEERVGPIDVLVNNAVVGRAVARHMVPRGGGRIVNIASVQADLARPTIAPYTAAKGGLRNLTRAMCAEWASAGLQVNALAPGYIHTEMTQALVDDPAFDGWVRGRTPAARWGRVEDLVGPAVFLASDAAAFVNGQVLFVDGGMTAVV